MDSIIQRAIAIFKLKQVFPPWCSETGFSWSYSNFGVQVCSFKNPRLEVLSLLPGRRGSTKIVWKQTIIQKLTNRASRQRLAL